MPNLRVISDNAIERAILSASSAATSFPVSNLKLGRKSDVWRSVGTSATLYANWSTVESINGVVLPFTNLSPTALIKVALYNEPAITNLLTAPNDFTNAAWTKTSVSLTPGVAGPDGTNSATTMTSSAANGGIRQVISGASAAYVGSIYIKLRAGFGDVRIRNASDATWKNASLVPGVWYRIGNNSSTVTSSPLEVQIINSGEAYDIAFAQVETNSVGFPTSYYPGIRPVGYLDTWQIQYLSSYLTASSNTLACPAPAVSPRGFTAAQAASAYAFGGGSCARLWLTTALTGSVMAVSITDTNNLQGYIEASHLLAGSYWEAATNFDYGASAQLIDSTKNERSDAGDLISDTGTISTKLSLPFSKLSPTDRATLWSILRAGGSRYPVFASMFPGHTDLALERDHQVYGKLVTLPTMALPFFNLASATVDLESI
jgi:hypothetical protein